ERHEHPEGRALNLSCYMIGHGRASLAVENKRRYGFMSTTYNRLFLAAAAVLGSTACFGQAEIQLRARQLPGWDPRAREGRCTVRVWVDNRAEVRMRG